MKARKPNFKQTEIGMIPEEWEVKSIGECCFLINKSFQPSEANIRPYIGLEHIEQHNLRLTSIGSSKDIESNKFEFKAGQILFGKLRPYFRKVIRPKFDGVCSTDIWVIDTKEENDNAFFFYFLADQRIIDEANNSSEGTRMPRARWDYLEHLKFPIPPVPEQHAIAKILSDLDAKIELNQQMNKTLEEIGRAIFKEWFINFNFPNEEGKPYKSSGGEMVYNEELGKEIPKGWRVEGLLNFFNVIYGKNIATKDIMLNGKFPVFGGNGIIGYLNDYEYKEPVTLISCRGAASGKIIITSPCSNVTHNSLVLLPKNERLNSYFIYYLLKMSDITQCVTGSAQPQITIESLKSLKIIIPSNKILDQIRPLLKCIFLSKFHNETQIQTLSTIRDLLLPKLMSGKIRVPASMVEDKPIKE